jgi:hypothetical protein
MARREGLKINTAETEFVMVENWASVLHVSPSTINLVKDFK